MGRTYAKALKRAETKDRRPKAVAKYIRISPYKVRAVLDTIRGKSYVEAVAILKNTNKSSSDPILKVLKSAGANAENNLGLNTQELCVAECYAGQGPTLKRYIVKARGGMGHFYKRTSHITIILDEVK